MAKLLILGPSYRRKTDPQPLPAIERYDGVYYRIVRKYMDKIRKKEIDVIIITEDLEIVDYKTPLPYKPPRGKTWHNFALSKREIEEKMHHVKEKIEEIIRSKRYEEVFIVLNKNYLNLLPDISPYVRSIIISSGGFGSKAKELKSWIG